MTAPAFAGARPSSSPAFTAPVDELPRAEGTTLDWWRISLVVVGALALAAGFAVIDGRPVGVVHDDAMYVILARSLASGQGYRFLNLPGAPAATHFPPGYPAFLALVSFVAPAFPASVVAFKACNAVLLAVAAMLLARFARARFVGAAWAVGLAVACGVSIPLLLLGSMVLSEPLFLAMLLALLPALEATAERATSARRLALLGAAIAACTLVRTHGIVLVPAVALVLVVKRRPRDAALVAGSAILCLLPWQLWSARHGGVLPAPLLGNYDSYAAWWARGFRQMGPSMVTATLAKTVPETTGMFAALFSPIRGAFAHAVTLVALGVLSAFGIAAVHRRAPVTLLFVAGYLAIVAIWPFPTARFVWGIWPLLLLLPVAGAAAAARVVVRAPSWTLPRAAAAALFACFAWVTVGYGLYELRGARGAWWASISRSSSARIAPEVQWIVDNTPADALLATEDEGAVYLYTGRRSLPVFSFTTAQYLRDHGAAENAREGLAPILAAYPVRFVVVGSLKTYEAAAHLTAPSNPVLGPAVQFPGGAAFTVLPR